MEEVFKSMENTYKIRFSNDIVVLAGNEKNLLKSLETIGSIFKIMCNIKMLRSRYQISMSVKLGGEILEHADNFTYFGSNITSDGKSTADIKARTAQAKQYLNCKKNG